MPKATPSPAASNSARDFLRQIRLTDRYPDPGRVYTLAELDAEDQRRGTHYAAAVRRALGWK